MSTSQGETITEDERAYLAALVESIKQIPTLHNEIASREAAMRSYAEYLHGRYELDATRGDTITENGVIQRATQRST